MTLSLAAAAAILEHNGSHQMWLGVPIVSWLAFAAAVIPAVAVARFLMALLVRLLEFAAARCGFPNVHYVLIGVTDALKCALHTHMHARHAFVLLRTLPRPPLPPRPDRPLVAKAATQVCGRAAHSCALRAARCVLSWGEQAG